MPITVATKRTYEFEVTAWKDDRFRKTHSIGRRRANGASVEEAYDALISDLKAQGTILYHGKFVWSQPVEAVEKRISVDSMNEFMNTYGWGTYGDDELNEIFLDRAEAGMLHFRLVQPRLNKVLLVAVTHVPGVK